MNTRTPSSADPHIVKLVEIEEKLRAEIEMILMHDFDLFHIQATSITDEIMPKINDYAQAKIDQIFEGLKDSK